MKYGMSGIVIRRTFGAFSNLLVQVMKSNERHKRTKRSRNKHDKSRVLLVEDHPIVLRGLAELLGEEPDLEICGEVGDGKGALNAVKKLQPDLAIIDLSLKDRSGLELIESLKAQHPQLVVLVLAMHDEFLYAERAFEQAPVATL